MRPIDADELKETISKYEFKTLDSKRKWGGECVLNFYMPKIIDDAPTIDAKPVKHGKCTKLDGDIIYLYECSVCKDTSDWHDSYCPNCGAKMDGGENGGL